MYALLPYGTSVFVILAKLAPVKAGSGDPDFSLAAYLRIPAPCFHGGKLRRNDKVSLRYEDSITY